MKKLIGVLMVAAPFIALLCLPLYTPAPWLAVLAAFGITTVIVVVVSTGLWLIGKVAKEEERGSN